jgi:chorismate mutase / prephenate dehydratase
VQQHRATQHSYGAAPGRVNVFFAFGGAPNYQYRLPLPFEPHMTNSKTTLDELRRRLDGIDDQVHDLLMRRAEIVQEVSAEKKGNNVPALRPGREAVILRRLAKRHTGSFPLPSLVRMWREMLAATVAMQTNFAVAVYLPEDSSGYWDLARDHFGSHTPMTPYRSIGQVIRAVTDGQASIGILPVPLEDDPDPWWRFFVSDDEATPRILARLPFAGRGNARSDGGDALAVGCGALEATGADHSLIVFETHGAISRARIFSGLAASKLECTFFADFKPSEEIALNLVELTDFVLPDDPRLAQFTAQISATTAVERVVSLGSYAVPLAIDQSARATTPRSGRS